MELDNNKDYVLSMLRKIIQVYTEQLSNVKKELKTLRVEADDIRTEIERLESSEKEIIEKWN